MGIPRLFRCLKERYPSLYRTVEANQLPNYDYFYIDVNFLLHKSVTENGLLPLEQADDEYLIESRIFERVLRQIETLHRIVPSKVLFLAIDGVAPRAKWMKQKNRRMKACERNGMPKEKSNDLPMFDTNTISPATVFMNNFEKVLIEFVANKMEMHKNWQNCDIYVSGSNVPGEGSIKIIDFIRNLKHSNDYVPNETHCIYSGDNDYILLGLATHELYISFIQEPKKCDGSLALLCSDDVKHKFSVIHFEMLRQYLRMEFIECESKMSFEFSTDRIVDDWVLLMTLIGNDYLPGLPRFDVHANTLSIIYDAYKVVLSESNSYMTENGILNVRRFTRFMFNLQIKDYDLYCNSINRSHENSISEKMAAVLNLNNETGSLDSFNDFLEMKYDYYAKHLGYTDTPDFNDMSFSYTKTMQWILIYYFRGTDSWNHYYPYKCAPFVSDFTTVYEKAFSFDVDKPADAFTHLLAILPKSSSHLLPTSYQALIVDNICFDMNELEQKTKVAGKYLDATDESRNKVKPTLKFQYIKTENNDGFVKTTEIPFDKKFDRVSNEKCLDRSLKRNDFNFKFSTLNLHHFSGRLVPSNLTTPYPRIMLTLEPEPEQFTDLDSVAEKYLNEIVYVDWPHFTEAKIMQIFHAEKKFDCSGDEIKITKNPSDFNTCVDSLKSRYNEAGIDVGEIKMFAFVAPLKWVEYQADDKSNEFKLVECWNNEKWKSCAIQVVSKRFMIDSKKKELLVKDAILDKNVFLFGGKVHYGEMATIVDDQGLETNGRVKILAYQNPDPDFQMAMHSHQSAKAGQMSEFKQPSNAAAILGLSQIVFAKITGSTFVNQNGGQRIIIGLQLKNRNTFQNAVSLLHDYVKIVGNKFIYSQKSIDLVKQYMDKFPRVFDVLSKSNEGAVSVSDFDGNNGENGLDYINEVRKWLCALPHHKERLKSVDLTYLSECAVKEVKKAIAELYTKDAKILKLIMKWQNLYIPDMNDVYVVPSPNAIYKLLDRIIIVRSGYPFDVGAKGTVIGIEPKAGHILRNDITDHELFALEILMDHPYTIKSNSHSFENHRIFHTRSTNMMINISHGRDY